MQYGDDLIRLALGHSALIEEAKTVLDEAERVFIEKLHEYIKSQLSDLFKISNIDKYYAFEFWIPEWSKSNEEEIIASFKLSYTGGEWTWLTILTGQTRATGYFSFKLNFKNFIRKDIKKEWKNCLRKYFHSTQKFKNTKFELVENGDEIIIPIKLNVSDLAEKYPDNLDECFGSVDSALEAIKTLLPEFEKIVQAMKNWENEGK